MLSLLNETILTLYRGCRDIAANDFKDWAMRTVQRAIRFDSGLWVTSELADNKFNSTYLFHQSEEMLESYGRVMGGVAHDPLAREVFATPGRTVCAEQIMSRAEFVAHPFYLKHCRIFGIEHTLATVHVSPVTQIPSAIAFYRADPDRPFMEPERATKELLVPHMIEAMRINLFASLLGEELGADEALAFCDPSGLLYETTPTFPGLVRAAWPDWNGPRLVLPCPTLEGADNIHWASNGLKLDATPCRDLFLVRVVRDNPLDRLSSRQFAVAELLARGKRYKDIARTLGISPSTVTNHVNQIHVKLGIAKREELVGLFNPRI